MGFEVFDPFLIDDDYHNFTSVNILRVILLEICGIQKDK
jgi:hypothetical protein